MRILLLLFFVLAFAETHAQVTKQLTFNNISDAQVALYKNKIVWVRESDHYSDIFLAENDTIKQLTYGSNFNFWPDVGSEYIVWLRRNTGPWSQESEKSLMYYDGFGEKELDKGSIYMPRTAGKYITWWKISNPNFENHTQQLMLFDGEKNHVLAVFNPKNIGYQALVTESEIVYIESDTAMGKSWLTSYNYDKKTVLDSIANGIFYINTNAYYQSRRLSKPLFLYDVYDRSPQKQHKLKYYIDGKIKELPLLYQLNDTGHFNHVVDANEDFITLLAHKRRHYYDTTVLKIWRNNTMFTVSKYPFTEVEDHSELNDITTFFRFNDTLGNSYLYVFQKGKIKQLSAGYISYPYWFSSTMSGKSIAWAFSVGKDYHNSEIYYYCGEDSCINAIPLKEFKAKMYYKMQPKQIAVEIETPQAEKFSLEVYDLLGRKVASTNFVSLYGTFTFLFPTVTITQGIYIVKLQNPSKPEQQFTQKLFIPN